MVAPDPNAPIRVTVTEAYGFFRVYSADIAAFINMTSPFYTNTLAPTMKRLGVHDIPVGEKKVEFITTIDAELPKYVVDLTQIYPYDAETIDKQSATPPPNAEAFAWVFKKYRDNVAIHTSISKRLPVVLSMHDFKVGIIPVNARPQFDTSLDPVVAEISALQAKLMKAPEFAPDISSTSYTYFVKKPSVDVAVHNIPKFSLSDVYFIHRHPFKMLFRDLRRSTVFHRAAAVPSVLKYRPGSENRIVTFNGEVVPHKSLEDAKISIIALLNDVTRDAAAALSG